VKKPTSKKTAKPASKGKSKAQVIDSESEEDESSGSEEAYSVVKLALPMASD
jgi:hypothetical protein